VAALATREIVVVLALTVLGRDDVVDVAVPWRVPSHPASATKVTSSAIIARGASVWVFLTVSYRSRLPSHDAGIPPSPVAGARSAVMAR
jgi:hypothetical protein